ncbi:hypothetical protein K504DRAFT_454248 [Pleomassaria siparia CBS 279.74]|uniref:Uncharacterized protein n=1 Tax=Pleomassaria siparia CBS 279.74 TaxID=1314801 RepID=A0A6G1JPH9_9PLEO|nr:hypothetical protein K504DRAFT_454248 [Pleomassaria siparia CBS 279.74]
MLLPMVAQSTLAQVEEQANVISRRHIGNRGAKSSEKGTSRDRKRQRPTNNTRGEAGPPKPAKKPRLEWQRRWSAYKGRIWRRKAHFGANWHASPVSGRVSLITAYEDLHEEPPTHTFVAAHIADFEGREGDEEAVYSEEEETDQDKDKEDEEAVHFLTSASYLHRTTGEDIYGMEPAI